MTGLSTATASTERKAQARNVRQGRPALRMVAALAGIVNFSILQGPLTSVRGGDDTPSGKSAVSPAEFVVEIQRILKADDDQLIGLAGKVFAEEDATARLMDELLDLRINAKKAEAAFLNAKLERELAEIAVKEYTEGTFVIELATLEGEIRFAEADLQRARDMTALAMEGPPRISAKLEERMRRSVLDHANTRKKVLVELTKTIRTKGLESQVAKARAVEMASQAEWELLNGRLERKQKDAAARPRRTDVDRSILALVDRAIPVEEKIRAKLEQIVKEPKIDDSLQKELRDLTNQLGAIVDEAEAVKTADDLTRLKPRIHEAARSGASASK